MKVVIQIPCWNESQQLAHTLACLPRQLPGVSELEIIVIDDGSSDATVAVAYSHGVDAVIRLGAHKGLAAAFSAGVEEALRRGADILVNTDADNQYPAEKIADLITPLVDNSADIVVGNRLHKGSGNFPPVKMMLERLGSAFVRGVSGFFVADAACGFRALSRPVLETMFIHGRFSYTMESLLLAGMHQFRGANVPITINPVRRKSRLFKSIPGYIYRSVGTVLRVYMMYHPLRFFWLIALVCFTLAGALGVRFLYYYLADGGAGHIQSLILLAVLANTGILAFFVGLVGDVIAANRRLIEQQRKLTIRQTAEHHDALPYT